MHEREKSDPAIRAGKPTNKARRRCCPAATPGISRERCNG
jgi:hypothetical protein